MSPAAEALWHVASTLSAFFNGKDLPPYIAMPFDTAFDAVIELGGEIRRGSSSDWPFLWAGVAIKGVEFYICGPKLCGPLTREEVAWIEERGGRR